MTAKDIISRDTLKRMLTEIDIERLPSFAIGFERGEARGEAKGEAQIVRRLLSQLDVVETAELLGLTPEEVERIASANDNTSRVHDPSRAPRHPNKHQPSRKSQTCPHAVS